MLVASSGQAQTTRDNRSSTYTLQSSNSALRVSAPDSFLAAAVRAALERDPDVRMAHAELSAADIETDIARSGYFPALSASSGPETKGLAYDVTLSQTLYDFGQVRSQVGRATAISGRRQADILVKRDDIALKVTELWLDIAAKRQSLGLMQGHLSELERLRVMAEDRAKVGYSDDAEVSRAQLAVATAGTVRARLEGELQEAENAYQIYVGRPADQVDLPDNPAFLTLLRSPDALESAIEAAPLYRRSVMETEAVSASLRYAEASRYPRVVLEGGVQRREIGGIMVDDSTIGIRLRMPTQQGFSSFQRPQLEAARLEASRLGVDAMTRDLQRTVSGLVTANRELEGQIEASGAKVSQSRNVRTSYWDQFRVGFRGLQDLIVIETEYFEAERQLLDLSVERLRNEYRAAAQLGLLADSFNTRTGRQAGQE